MKKMSKQADKRWLGVMLLVVMLAGLLSGQVLAAEDISGKFTCANFLAAVRELPEVPDEGPIYQSHVANVTQVWVSGDGITSLDGIEYFGIIP